MIRIVLAFCLWSCTALLWAADQEASRELPEGSGPWVVRAYFDDKPQLYLLTRRTAPWNVQRREGYALVEVPNRFEYQRLLNEGFRVSIDNALTDWLRNPPGSMRAIPNFACYRTVEETYQSMDQLAAQHPQLVQVLDIGDSWDKQRNGAAGYDLRVLKITNRNISGSKPVMFAMSALHAREYATAETLTRFAESLLAAYATDADVRWMLDHQELHLLLQANPDGRKRAEQGASWRKNINDAYCPTNNNFRGADLNRNFPYQWGAWNGSSGDSCSQVYRGPMAASEPESAAILAYVNSIFPDYRADDFTTPAPSDSAGIFLDVHSAGGLLLWPWGFRPELAPNGISLATLGRRLAWFNNYQATPSIDLYPTDGTTIDQVYGTRGVAAFAYELGSVFFEPCSNFENNVLPVNIASLKYALRVARRPYEQPAGPETTSVFAAPLVEQGETLELAALIDDTRFRQAEGVEATQNVTGGVAYLNQLPWAPGATPLGNLQASDGAFNSSSELARISIPSSGLSLGPQVVYLRGQDSAAAGPITARGFNVVAPGTSGRLAGVVRNLVNSAPINVPALIRLGDIGTVSLPGNGSQYSLRAADGNYSGTVSAEGYASANVAGLIITSPLTNTQNFSLMPMCEAYADDASIGVGHFSATEGWGVSTTRALSAPQSFHDSPAGNYAANANNSLVSQSFNFANATAVSLEFQSFCDTEFSSDYGQVEVSTNGGSNWSGFVYRCSGGQAWEKVRIDLPQLAGVANARIRFRLISDGFTQRDGWYVDDILVRAARNTCQPGGLGVFANAFE